MNNCTETFQLLTSECKYEHITDPKPCLSVKLVGIKHPTKPEFLYASESWRFDIAESYSCEFNVPYIDVDTPRDGPQLIIGDVGWYKALRYNANIIECHNIDNILHELRKGSSVFIGTGMFTHFMNHAINQRENFERQIDYETEFQFFDLLALNPVSTKNFLDSTD